MKLEAVRTVLKNEVNEISVCVDLKRKSGVFYTVVSVTGAEVRRRLASMMATEGLFCTNSEFIGSFSHADSLNLVFLYRNESALSRLESIYAVGFVRRRTLAENLLVALAETQLTGSVGLLLTAPANVNVSPDLSVYFNYFLDFAQWDPEQDAAAFYRQAARLAFEVLSREYGVRYDGQVSRYPSELQVFYKKMQLKGFASFNGILTVVRLMPDAPAEPSVGLRKLWDRVLGAVCWIRRNAMLLFLVTIVVTTVIYTAYQIALRASYRSAALKNVTYIGLDTIGEVYLGDENV